MLVYASSTEIQTPSLSVIPYSFRLSWISEQGTSSMFEVDSLPELLREVTKEIWHKESMGVIDNSDRGSRGSISGLISDHSRRVTLPSSGPPII